MSLILFDKYCCPRVTTSFRYCPEADSHVLYSVRGRGGQYLFYRAVISRETGACVFFTHRKPDLIHNKLYPA